LGLGGFAALLKKPPRVLERIEFALELGDAGALMPHLVDAPREGGTAS
jgi:hypothetical protein